MHRAPGPGPSEVGRDSGGVQPGGDLDLVDAVLDEPPVHPLDGLDFLGRAGTQHDAVGLQALVFADFQRGLFGTGLVQQHPAQSEPGGAALAETQFDEAALAGEHLGREFAAVFPGHRALDALDDGGDRGPVVLELLGTVDHADAGLFTHVFVMGALVGVLKAAPAADVVDQDDLEVGVLRPHVRQQALQSLASTDVEPAFAFVGVGAHDLDTMAHRVFQDFIGLVLRRVLLMLGRHAHVAGGADQRGF